MRGLDNYQFIVREKGAAPLYFAGVAVPPPLFAFRYAVNKAAATRFMDVELARGAAGEMQARMPGTRWEVLAVRAKPSAPFLPALALALSDPAPRPLTGPLT